MIEEFPFTTRVLQTEKDINSLKSFIVQAVREAKERLASQTWARLTWEQRVTLHPTVGVATSVRYNSPVAYYTLPTTKIFSRLIKCETLSQMQFGEKVNL